jgi:hypothetical protein
MGFNPQDVRIQDLERAGGETAQQWQNRLASLDTSACSSTGILAVTNMRQIADEAVEHTMRRDEAWYGARFLKTNVLPKRPTLPQK